MKTNEMTGMSTPRGRAATGALWLIAALSVLAACTAPMPGPGSESGRPDGPDSGSSAGQAPPRSTVDAGAPAQIDPALLGEGDGSAAGEAAGEGDGEGAGAGAGEGEIQGAPDGQQTVEALIAAGDPIAAATELALATIEAPEGLEAMQRLMARSGEAARLESADIRGLAIFLADASRIDQETILGVGGLSAELDDDPDLIEDPTWLAKALPVVEAAARVGRTIEGGLDGPEWPADMQILVEQTLRGQIVVPLLSGSAGFTAAVRTEDAAAAAEALESTSRGVAGLVAALEQMPVLMLAAERATQTAEAP